ncbi:hypothetical protein QBK99_14340 [Corticibacterium sp. UT-5YL-CI-8]|nr:hypothetical protein [Tianweitania sp. UT-5YL-CI-8]
MIDNIASETLFWTLLSSTPSGLQGDTMETVKRRAIKFDLKNQVYSNYVDLTVINASGVKKRAEKSKTFRTLSL